MMIKIEVTGNSIPEVADKLLAIGASLQGIKTTMPVVDASKAAAIAAAGDIVREVAEAAPVDPTPAPKSAPIAEATESQPTTEQPSSTPAASAEEITPKPAETAADTPAAPAEEIATLNFETQVAPVVLLFVQKRSKEETSKILAEFGVERASMLDPALWPELVARLEAEMS